MAMNLWTDTLDAAGIKAYHARTAIIDPAFAKGDAEFYAARSINELRALVQQAWNCNDSTAYMISRSYLALKV